MKTNKINIEADNKRQLKLSEKEKRGLIKLAGIEEQVSYTVLNHNRDVHQTIVVSEHCNVDIDEEGYPIGIETI